MGALHGIWGRPYLDLEPMLNVEPFEALHEEACLALCDLSTTYTGGSLKWLGCAAPWVQEDGYTDLGHVIESFTLEQFQTFVSLGEKAEQFDLSRFEDYRFGDETDLPLSRRQMLYLKYRYGVYFPWKVMVELLANHQWEDKHRNLDKQFAPEASAFPKLMAYIEHLPFKEIGRCVLFGLESNDHATLHRDTEPSSRLELQHSITLCPAGNKRFYLTDSEGGSVTEVTSRAYWFNDMDYHGVAPDPYFRYSIRIDGVFQDSFKQELQERFAPGHRRR